MFKGRNIVVKKLGNSIYLPTTEMLEIESVGNIPGKPYSMCRITDYDESTGTIHLFLLTDLVNERQFSLAVEVNSVDLMSANIKKVIFDNLSPKVLYSPLSQDKDIKDYASIYEEKLKNHVVKKSISSQEWPDYDPEEPHEVQVADFKVELPVNDLNFENGKVTFEHYIQHVSRKVQFDILNSFIKKEFDSIKTYFSKALGTKKFTISIRVESRKREIITQSATSPHIDKINSSLFEIVEEYCIEDSFLNNSEDEIYSLNEKAKEISQKTGSDKIQDADWLLNKLITQKRTKHYFHLRFLSSKHLKDVFPLRITGKPISFIFLLSNGNGYCLVWETYSTEEATYVWKLNNMNSQQFQFAILSLVEKIKWLRKNNKMIYIRQNPENFTRIEHDYSGEDSGFNKWKKSLEEVLATDIS